MTLPESEIRKYLHAFFSEPELTRENLLAGEEHYTPPTKDSLSKAGLPTQDDQTIKEAERTGQALAENNSGFYKAPPEWLKLVCSKLGPGRQFGDQLNDAFTIATTLAPMVPALFPAAPYFTCSFIAFTAVRIGIRRACSELV